MRLFPIFLLSITVLAADREFTADLWQEIRPIYAKTLEHAFLKGLADGTLPRATFQFYLLQDAQYLRVFGQALSVLAAKAPREEWTITLNTHAVDALKTERQLHESILRSFGVTDEAMRAARMAPTNYAYTNHLLTTAYQRPFGEGLAAMLPCYWVYWEAGKELKKRGSRNAEYQRWIDQYSDPNYGHVVEQVLSMMNAEARRMDASSRSEAHRLFTLSARYEYMFWDMAWRREQWAP